MRRMKVILAIPYWAILFVAIFTWMTVFYPFAFLAYCSLTNNTATTITVTPVGTAGSDGTRRLLPLYRTSFPFFKKSQRGAFEVAPNETLQFCYDMDDINFSEIVIGNADGNVRLIVVNEQPTLRQYTAPEKTDFAVTDINSLPSVPSKVKLAADMAQQLGNAWIVYFLSAILIAFEFGRHRLAKAEPSVGHGAAGRVVPGDDVDWRQPGQRQRTRLT
ncbi:MAG: hypothetical protein KDA92_00115 [Planctomycetales bacterium]|nr:hypothetical protein [Planctomycetales bacterium]MCA9166030.1 hypothetical protein [Planctomycetales bacterium]